MCFITPLLQSMNEKRKAVGGRFRMAATPDSVRSSKNRQLPSRAHPVHEISYVLLRILPSRSHARFYRSFNVACSSTSEKSLRCDVYASKPFPPAGEDACHCSAGPTSNFAFERAASIRSIRDCECFKGIMDSGTARLFFSFDWMSMINKDTGRVFDVGSL